MLFYAKMRKFRFDELLCCGLLPLLILARALAHQLGLLGRPSAARFLHRVAMRGLGLLTATHLDASFADVFEPRFPHGRALSVWFRFLHSFIVNLI